MFYNYCKVGHTIFVLRNEENGKIRFLTNSNEKMNFSKFENDIKNTLPLNGLLSLW